MTTGGHVSRPGALGRLVASGHARLISAFLSTAEMVRVGGGGLASERRSVGLSGLAAVSEIEVMEVFVAIGMERSH